MIRLELSPIIAAQLAPTAGADALGAWWRWRVFERLSMFQMRPLFRRRSLRGVLSRGGCCGTRVCFAAAFAAIFNAIPTQETADRKPADRIGRENVPWRADFAADLRAGCEKLGV
jgi:hypothetical protein